MNPIRIACMGLLITVAACQPEKAAEMSAPVATPYATTASIQELMKAIVDPSADKVWDSVGTTVTAKGTDERRPRTEEEWQEVRNGVIAVVEASNLLMMPGRRIVPEGGKMLDEGSEGVLPAKEAQQNFDTHHAAFVGLASSLHGVGLKMLKAVDERNADALFEIGTEMDSVCESCHMTFWYPGQPVYRAHKN